MQITTLLSDELEGYLSLSGAELKLTAQNMANVDTPGYRTVGFDFAEEMRGFMGETIADRRAEMEGGTKAARRNSSVSVRLVDGLIERPDGNNVSMDREGLKMAEAQLEFRAGVELIKSEFSNILDAIHADSK
jgi:flagellar basal-body rod protein FlgB